MVFFASAVIGSIKLILLINITCIFQQPWWHVHTARQSVTFAQTSVGLVPTSIQSVAMSRTAAIGVSWTMEAAANTRTGSKCSVLGFSQVSEPV